MCKEWLKIARAPYEKADEENKEWNNEQSGRPPHLLVNWAITDFYFVSIFSITPLQERITAEFNWLRLIDLLWLLSGDKNLSIVVLVDFLWFQERNNTFSLLFVSRQQAQWIKVVSNKFRMSSRCFNHFDLKKLKPGWRQAGARGQSGQEGRQLYCCGQEVDEYDQEGVCIVVVILWGWLFWGFIRWHYQARLSAR